MQHIQCRQQGILISRATDGLPENLDAGLIHAMGYAAYGPCMKRAKMPMRAIPFYAGPCVEKR